MKREILKHTVNSLNRCASMIQSHLWKAIWTTKLNSMIIAVLIMRSILSMQFDQTKSISLKPATIKSEFQLLSLKNPLTTANALMMIYICLYDFLVNLSNWFHSAPTTTVKQKWSSFLPFMIKVLSNWYWIYVSY